MTVNLSELKQLGIGHGEKRRGRRMNSRVPVRLEWDSTDSGRVSVNTVTRIVNPYGCMIILRHSLDLNHRIALTNLSTQSSNAAVEVWKGNPQPDGWEYGVELVTPEMDFWDIEL